MGNAWVELAPGSYVNLNCLVLVNFSTGAGGEPTVTCETVGGQSRTYSGDQAAALLAAIKAAARQEGRSRAANVKDATDTTKGTIKIVSDADRAFVMTDKNGKDWMFHLDPTANVRLANKEGKLADLMKGDEVEIKYLKKGDDFIAEEVERLRAG
jgi:hypothetical protein